MQTGTARVKSRGRKRRDRETNWPHDVVMGIRMLAKQAEKQPPPRQPPPRRL